MNFFFSVSINEILVRKRLHSAHTFKILKFSYEKSYRKDGFHGFQPVWKIKYESA
jgi:hypothetical protein